MDCDLWSHKLNFVLQSDIRKSLLQKHLADFKLLYLLIFQCLLDKMPKKANDSKVSLSQKVISSVFCRLKIPNFFTLPEYDNGVFNIETPSFEFANETWRFRFSSQKRHERYKSFSVHVIRETSSELPFYMILYSVTLLDAVDEDYMWQNDTCIFHHGRKNFCLGLPFDNRRPGYDKRDIMTLFIHLVPDGSVELDAYAISSSTGRGKQTYNVIVSSYVLIWPGPKQLRQKGKRSISCAGFFGEFFFGIK